MRIIPHELYKYSPDIALCALRKEFGMYDYCLNMNIRNQGMQSFLDLGRVYFNLLIKKWVEEMKKREHYVNTFHLFYFQQVINTQLISTDVFLILECCIQWDIKDFKPYNINLSWYQIVIKILKKNKKTINNFNLENYHKLLQWYQNYFMKINKNGKLKPYKLNIFKVILFFSEFLKNNKILLYNDQ
ncbi:conserved hypothetical protein [Candidatus Phytoplasma mali]|uniref:Uncharacterized protein n=1 Tax=Phytoplasma mali (strain AT) TaxID=482235 RepID=B3QZQ0_PHYMT|nr:hypothetical protein [Candidatus Phytoplasma mali]CAP18437.1 conserved hypothetical protein [Candidatus Phytoplasma mali]